jgi:hypothetical protein
MRVSRALSAVGIAVLAMLINIPAVAAAAPGGVRAPRTTHRGKAASPAVTPDPASAEATASIAGAVPAGPAGPAAVITVRKGNRQAARPNEAFAGPFTVAVTDRVGRPVAGAPVRFEIQGGDASFAGLSSRSVASDAGGIAAATGLVAGRSQGTFVVAATTPGVKGSVRFSAMVLIDGFHLLTSDGHLWGVGLPDLSFDRSASDGPVAVLATPSGGSVVVTAMGAVTVAGDPADLGRVHAEPSDPIVGAALTSDARGLWAVTRAGRVLSSGTAGPVNLAPGAPVASVAANRGSFSVVRSDGTVEEPAAPGHLNPRRAASGASAAGAVGATGNGDGSDVLVLAANGTVIHAATGHALPVARAGHRPVAVAGAEGAAGFWVLYEDGSIGAFEGAPAAPSVSLSPGAFAEGLWAAPLRRPTPAASAVPASTHVLAPSALKAGTVASDGTITIGNTEAKDIRPGDVVVANPSAGALHGLVRRVVSVNRTGTSSRLSTTAASLRDAAPDFAWAVGGSLGLGSGSAVPKSASGQPVARASAPGSNQSYNVGPFNAYICQAGGGLTTTSCSGTPLAALSAGMTITPSTDIGLSCNLLLQCQAHAIGTLDEQAQATADFNSHAEYNGTTRLTSFQFDTIPIDIGPFVVIVQPTFNLDLNVHAEVTAQAHFTMTQNATASAGLTYDNGSLTPQSSFSNSFPSPTVKGGVQAKAYAELEPRLDFLIDDLAGAYAAIRGRLEFDVDTAATPWWNLFAEVGINVGLDLTRIFGSDAKIDVPVYTQDFPIAQATTPPVQITSGAPPDPLPAGTYRYPMAATGGIGPYAWKLSGNPPGLTVDPNTGLLAGSPGPGLVTFDVIVTDSAGSFDQITYQLSRTDSFTYRNVVRGTYSSVQGSGASGYWHLDDARNATNVAPAPGTSSPPGTYPDPGHTTYRIAGAIDGDPNVAVSFAGGGATVPADTFPAAAAARTLEVWVNSASCCPNLISYPGLATSVTTHDGQDWIVVTGASASAQFPAGRVDDGAWHLIDVTYDGANAAAYVDGQPAGASQAVTVSSVVAGAQITLGGAAASYDEPAIYNLALSPAVLLVHWTAGGSRATAPCAPAATSPYAVTITHDHPSGYWRVGEKGLDPRGRVAYDSTSGCQNGAVASGAQPQSYAVASYDGDGALTLGGTVTAPSAKLPQGSAARTVEVWVKSDPGCCGDFGFQPLIGYGGLRVGAVHYNGREWLRVYNDVNAAVDLPYQSDSYRFTDGTWHLIDVTSTGGTVSGWVDGANLGSATLAVTTSPALPLTVGGIGGSYDEAAVYPSVLPPSRLSAHYAAGVSATPCVTASTTGYGAAVMRDTPTAYYRLGDLVATPQHRVMFDSSGACMNGAFGAGSQPVSPGAIRSGSDDGAAALFGATGQASSLRLPQGSTQRSLEFWFNDNFGCCGDFGFNPMMGYSGMQVGAVHYNATEWIRVISPAGSVDLPYFAGTNFRFTDGFWHLIDVTYAGGTVTAWIDGAPVGSGALAVTTSAGSGGMTIGGTGGYYDEAAVYPTALGAAQIDAHWTAGASTRGACAPAPTDQYGTSVLSDHPAVYWRMGDEVADSATRVALDSSGNCRNGAYPPVVAPYSGGGLQKGEDGSIQLGATQVIGSAATLPLSAAPRTVEFWFNSDFGCCGNFGFNPLMSYGGFSIGAVHYNNTEWIRVYNEANVAVDIPYFAGTNFSFTDGEWHLLDVGYNGANVTAFVDGAAIGTAALAVATPATGTTLVVGYSGGIYDEAAVYPAALNAARIDAHWTAGASTHGACAPGPTGNYPAAVSADSPALYWRLGDMVADQTTRVAYDSSGHCSNGAYSDKSTGYAPGALASGDDGAVSLGGQMTGSAAALPAGSAARTLEVWLKSDFGCCGDFGFNPLMSYGGFSFGAVHYNNTEWIRVYNEANVAVDIPDFAGSNRRFTDGHWHAVAVSYDGTNATAYVDGAQIGLAALVVATPTTGATMVVGYAGGVYDEAAVYPTALTLARIHAHYIAGEFDKQVPSAPQQVVAQAGTTARSIVISWQPPANAGSSPVISYRIYRSSGGSNYVLAGSTSATAAAFTDSGLTTGLTYTYVMAAVSANGEGLLSPTTNATAP